jgi:hypothetical protein
MMRPNRNYEPRRFGRLILPLTVTAPLIMSACSAVVPPPQSYAVRNPDGTIYDPATSAPAYAPPLAHAPVSPPAAPVPGNDNGGVNAEPAPQPPDIPDEPEPQPRRHYQQPPARAQPEDQPFANPPLSPPAVPEPSGVAPPPSATIHDDCVGYWRICHFL